MKLKIFCLSAFFLFFLSAAPLHAQWTDRLTLYLPNRVLDIMDIFTLDLGGGPTLHGELYITRACEIGGGIGYTFQFIKDHNRQYGYAALNGFGAYLPFATREDIERAPGSLFVPEECPENLSADIKGLVNVSFVVNKDGSLSDITLRKGVDPALDEQVIQAFKGMPKWKPAKKDGKSVRSSYMMAVGVSKE